MRRRVALKVLPAEVVNEPGVLERFRREARAVAALDHPNIVRAFDFRQEGALHFLVMEYVEGASLQELVNRQGPLPIAQACAYIQQAALGLQHAHEAGLVHRDIKPANLLVDRAGVVKILDLGLARYGPEGESLTKKFDEGAVRGTADYIAPEQALNLHNVDGRADVYSLGATLYALLAGQPPFHEGTVAQKLLWHQMLEPTSLRELRPQVPEELAEVVAGMMAKDPADRFQSPVEVIEALQPWAAEAPLPPSARLSGTVALRPAQGAKGRSSRNLREEAVAAAKARDDDTRRRIEGRPLPRLDPPPSRVTLEVRAKDLSVERNLRPVLMLGGGVLVMLGLIGGVIAFVALGSRGPQVDKSSAPAAAKLPEPAPPRRPKILVQRTNPPAFRTLEIDGLLFSLATPTGSPERLTFAPDGRHLLSAGTDCNIQVWDLDLRISTTTLAGHTDRVLFAGLSGVGNQAVTASQDGTARLWNWSIGKLEQTLVGHDKTVWCAVFSRDDRQVITGGRDGTVRFWEASTGRLQRTIEAHELDVNWVALSPDGKTLLSGSWDKSVKLWDVKTGALVRQFPEHPGSVHTVAFTPSGDRVLTGSSDGVVRMFQTDNGELLHEFTGHRGAVWSVAVEGRYLLSGGADQFVRLWDLDKRQLVRAYSGHTRPVGGVAFAPDGKHFASCSLDGTIRLWGLPRP
jgi:WD40 repeat protein